MLFGFVFIYPHNREADKVHQKQVNQSDAVKVHRKFSFEPGRAVWDACLFIEIISKSAVNEKLFWINWKKRYFFKFLVEKYV